MNCHTLLLVNVRKLTITSFNNKWIINDIISHFAQLFCSLLPHYLDTVVRAVTTACCFCLYFSSHYFLLSFPQYLLYPKLSKQWGVGTYRLCQLCVYNIEAWDMGHGWMYNKTKTTLQHGSESLWWLLGPVGLMCRVYSVTPSEYL